LRYLVFPYEMLWQYFDRDSHNPVMGASNAGGVRKDCDFQLISYCISETMQDRAIITMECQ